MPGGDYKSLCHIYLSGVGGGRGRLCKIKYGFEGSISNLDLGLLNFSVLGEMEKKLGCGLVGGSVPRLKPFSDTERL